MSNRSWQYTTRGRPSQTLSLVTKDIPKAGPGEIVIKIHAAALNPVDIQLAQYSDEGLKAWGAVPMGTPFCPGMDLAGVVHDAGEGSRWKVGDEVFGMRLNADGEYRLKCRGGTGGGPKRSISSSRGLLNAMHS
jgi:NADPH:quinone reductase-like Zn-dependent oxidoreductase